MTLRLLNALLNPHKIVQNLWARTGLGSFKSRLDYDVFPRPHYAFCLYHAARQAHLLGLKRISAAEFGVAGGAGLIELEDLADAVEKEFPVEIEIYGFDTGGGLPEPVDFRDLPYIWKAGFYKMDQDALRKKLRRASLVLGDVKDTVPSFIENHDPAPIGAAFFDLDFWSSTSEALKIFEAPQSHMLPRVMCYCDDVISSEHGGLLNEYVGQLAAIRGYNAQHANRKLTTIAGLDRVRRIPACWNDQVYVHHAFDHPLYNVYIHSDANRQLPI